MKLVLAFALLAALSPTWSPSQVEVQLRRSDGGPVAGAQVRWFEGEAPRFDLGAFDELARASGKLAIADVNGRVLLEAAPQGAHVVASLAGWWGTARAGERERGVVLHPDGDLLVETIGARGEPVGDVPFALELRERAAPRNSVVVLRGRTGRESGRAVLSHAWVAREAPQSSTDERATTGEWSLRILATPRDQAYRVALGDTWPERVRLSAAALAHVQVTVVDSDGAPAFEGGEVDVRVARKPHLHSSDVRPWRRSVSWDRSEHTCPIAAGEARLWPLLRWGELRVAARFNALSDWTTARVPWDDTPDDQQVRVVVQPILRVHRLRLTLAGAPLPDTAAEIRRLRASDLLPALDDRDGALACSTDAGGVVAFTIDTAFRPTILASAHIAGVGLRTATVELPDTSMATADAIVDVPLGEPGRLRGVVVDARGAPIPRASVSADDRDRLVTDDLGRFERTLARSLELELRAEAPGFLPRRLVHDTSDGDVRIVLDRAASLRAHVRAGGPAGVEDLNLLLLRRELGVPLEAAPGCSVGCSCEGAFEFVNVTPGRYTLIVRRASSGAAPIELARRDEIEIVGGQALDLGELRIE